MNNLYINFYDTGSYMIDDAKENFKYSKAYKYLVYYNQGNNNYYNLFDNKNYDLEEDENYYIEEVNARWYSQSERQKFTFYFDPDIKKDSEAMEELKYFLDNLQYYFTAQAVNITWYIKDIKIIDWKEYIYKENLETLHIELLDEEIKESYINEYLLENWIDKEKFELVYDTEKIIY